MTTTPRALTRRFRLIAFDWDGTAVANRRADATAVTQRLERLLRSHVAIVIITGTNFTNVDRQFSSAVQGPHKRHLFVCTNRGSEVFGFDHNGSPVQLALREASPAEDALLTEVAEATRDEVVATTGLDIRIVYDRLNRRKIDVIPLHGWEDPPKDRIGDLVEAVEQRFAGAGVPGGLRYVFETARRIAREKGLVEARVTSDVKHIEIGLTDKADSVAWMLREIAAPRAIPMDQILIGGDEFGPVGGFPGSDSRMMTPEADGAVFVSVGPEPGGAPPPIIHLGGGPPAFLRLLEQQAALHPVDLPFHATVAPDWVHIEEEVVPTREHELESIFAVANGHLGCRGALAEGSPLSAPATLVAGTFFTPPEEGAVPDLLRLPDWTRFALHVDGHPVRLDEGETLEHRRILDFHQGVQWREWRHRDSQGRVTRLRGFRLASQSDRRLLLQSVTVTPENYSARIVVERAPVRAAFLPASDGTGAAFAMDGMLERPEAVEPLGDSRTGQDLETIELDVDIGKSYRFDRIVSVVTSRQSDNPEQVAAQSIQSARRQGMTRLLEAHRRQWAERWRDSDVGVEGDPRAQRALRFALYHLLSSADPNDEHVSIGARALTGPAYKGHVFWDTEIFMLPFFTYTWPAAARALLMYRYHTLSGARNKARKAGYRGAMYSWESADTGEEVTPESVVFPNGKIVPVLAGILEHHISADVAWAVIQYWRATGDDDFLVRAGAEIVLETARFWASRVSPGSDGSQHILEVIGPDEYHEGIDDNAFTNVMAQWNLRQACHVSSILREQWPDQWNELARKLDLHEEELGSWEQIANGMYTGFDPSTGLFEQFRGFHSLEYIDLARYEKRTAPMDVLLGRERVKSSQVVKQADVIMLIALLWDQFPPQVREANFRYYDLRTGHGSSLSPPVHALVAARLGDVKLAEKYFHQTAEIDLADNMGNASGGVHAAALGGLWQSVVFGFAGLQFGEHGPTLNPNLPASWRHLRCAVQWRGRRFELSTQAGHRLTSDERSMEAQV